MKYSQIESLVSGRNSQQIVEALDVEVDLDPDSTSYTWSGLYDKLTVAGFTESSLDALEAGIKEFPGGAVLANSLASGGLNFAREDLQTKLAAMLASGSLTADQIKVVTALKRVGQPVGKRWQKLGLSESPTVEQVQALIDKQAKLDLIDTAKAAELALLQQHGTARNRLENVEAVVDGLTLQQVTDEIAEIRTYPDTYTVPGGE